MVPKKSYMLISPVQCVWLGKAKPVWCHAQTVAGVYVQRLVGRMYESLAGADRRFCPFSDIL